MIPNFTGKFNVDIVRGCRGVKTQSFTTAESEYFNNKKLSEESSYVINRRKEAKYVGNNLEKPRVFLKRI